MFACLTTSAPAWIAQQIRRCMDTRCTYGQLRIKFDSTIWQQRRKLTNRSVNRLRTHVSGMDGMPVAGQTRPAGAAHGTGLIMAGMALGASLESASRQQAWLIARTSLAQLLSCKMQALELMSYPGLTVCMTTCGLTHVPTCLADTANAPGIGNPISGAGLESACRKQVWLIAQTSMARLLSYAKCKRLSCM